MFFQRDYVLRMIEMLGELIRRICSILREADARQELDEISGKACGMPMAMLRTTEPEPLTELLGEAQRYLVAELLLIDMEISRRTQMEDALLPVRIQAISIFASITDIDYVLPACDRVAKLLEGFLDELPLEVLLLAAGLSERGGRYATAEDALFAALSLSPVVRDEAEAFYGRLGALSDQALLEGNFSRDEIAEGLAALNG